MPKIINVLTHLNSTRMKDKRIPINPIKIRIGCAKTIKTFFQ